MQTTSWVWNVALVCLLVCSISHVSGYPAEEMQADDWSASTLITHAVNCYVKPYAEPLVDRVTNSTAWSLLGSAVNQVQGTANLAGEFFYTYYEDHFKERTEKTKQWLEEAKKSFVERIRDRFQTKEQDQAQEQEQEQ